MAKLDDKVRSSLLMRISEPSLVQMYNSVFLCSNLPEFKVCCHIRYKKTLNGV